MSATKYISLNINGANHVIKRKKLLSWLKRERVNIALLQETHLNDKEHENLRREWVGQVYYSSFSTSKRGVAILINKNTPFTLENCIKDINGRYVLISGVLYGERIMIGCIYAPNTYDRDFYSTLLADVSSLSSSYTILAGDWNCVADPEADHKPPSRAKLSKMSRAMREVCSDLDLFDTWRVLHPKERDFTFFSNPHKSFSRIDYIYTSRQVLDRVEKCTIGSRLLSDHADISVLITPPFCQPNTRRWRLNPSILNSPAFVEYMEMQIEQFLLINDNDDTNPSILWETLKAYVRGAAISYCSARKKEALKNQIDLEKQLSDLDKQLKDNPSRVLRDKTEATRSALNQLLTQKAEASIFYSRHRLFEMGDKPGRLLARLAAGRQNYNSISALKDDSGQSHYETTALTEIMKNYYEKLYAPDSSSNADSMLNFLEGLSLPSLSDADRNILGKSITPEEVTEAITSMQSGKAPGPDGYGPEFFKKFKKLLIGPLTKMYLHSIELGQFPPTLYAANISVILKKGKPPDECGSYRPISLINVDSKIFSKLLARRLENYLPSLIAEGQTGFIKERVSQLNMRKLLGVIQHNRTDQGEGLVISCDAAKAFDNILFPYLFSTLEKFGLGEDFINMLKLIYHSPRASVLINGMLSAEFSVGKGVRQGDPISPLIFDLAIEPLAEAIRSHINISGIQVGPINHKIVLYADDVLLFVTNPSESIPAIMSVINMFGAFSGYRLNFDKCVTMPLGGSVDTPCLPDFPFSWSTSGFTYLGISITPNVKDLLRLNFSNVLQSVRRDLTRWFDLPVSWMGRINLIKMNVLPRLLYPMQMLPLFITKKVIRDIEREFSNFIWHGKKPRLSMKVLQLPKDRGGLAFPNLLYYNWACHCRTVYGWVHDFLTGGPEPLETWECSPYVLLAELTDIHKVHFKSADSPILSNHIKIWKSIMSFTHRRNVSSYLTPLMGNRHFVAGVRSGVFRSWYDRGIRVIGELFVDGVLMSFEMMQDSFGVPRNDFFAYLQMRHFINTDFKLPVDKPLLGPLEGSIVHCFNEKGLISYFYNTFLDFNKQNIDKVQEAWERDIQIEYDAECWTECIQSSHTTFISNRFKEMQYRILHRQHRTPQFLNKIDPSRSPLCIKCKNGVGTYIHCFWECPKISRFWSCVAKELSSILKTKICKDPGLFILGLPPKLGVLDPKRTKLLYKLLCVARKCILFNWIKEKPPSITQWYREIYRVFPMERLSAKLKDKEEDFLNIWQPLIDYLPRDLATLVYKGCDSLVWKAPVALLQFTF